MSEQKEMCVKHTLRKGVFYPSFLFMTLAIIVGILKNDWLKSACRAVFRFSLLNFGWLYQIVAVICLFSIVFVTFSRI